MNEYTTFQAGMNTRILPLESLNNGSQPSVNIRRGQQGSLTFAEQLRRQAERLMDSSTSSATSSCSSPGGGLEDDEKVAEEDEEADYSKGRMGGESVANDFEVERNDEEEEQRSSSRSSVASFSVGQWDGFEVSSVS